MTQRSTPKNYVIVEYFTATQYNYVTANSKQDALDKVLNGEADEFDVTEPFPQRPMTIRDVRLDRRFS